MNTQIVTAIYFGQPEFPYYTWPYQARLERYLYSLSQLTRMNVPIKCYVNDYTEPLVKELNLKNLTIIKKHLDEFRYSSKLRHLKDNNEIEKTYLQSNSVKMYHEIDFGKLSILRDNYSDSEYTYWVDSGLSYWSLWPNKYNPYPIDGMSSTVTNYRFDKVFNTDFIKNINKYVGNKLLCLGNRCGVNTKVFPNFNYELGYNMVGGIIGGNVSHMEDFLSEFDRMFDEMFKKNIIINHEALMSIISHERPDIFKNWLFDTWDHENSLDSQHNPVYIPKNYVRFSDFVEDIK